MYKDFLLKVLQIVIKMNSLGEIYDNNKLY